METKEEHAQVEKPRWYRSSRPWLVGAVAVGLVLVTFVGREAYRYFAEWEKLAQQEEEALARVVKNGGADRLPAGMECPPGHERPEGSEQSFAKDYDNPYAANRGEKIEIEVENIYLRTDFKGQAIQVFCGYETKEPFGDALIARGPTTEVSAEP